MVPVWSRSVGGGAEWKKQGWCGGKGGGRCGRDNLAAHSETLRGGMCRGSCGIIYSISSPGRGQRRQGGGNASRKLISPRAFHRSRITQRRKKKTSALALLLVAHPPSAPARFVLGRLCGHFSGLRPPFRAVCDFPPPSKKDVCCTGFVCGATCARQFVTPPTIAIRDEMLTCLSSTAVSWTCAPLHPPPLRGGFSVGQLDRWAERKASVKVPVSRQTGCGSPTRWDGSLLH